MSETIDLLKETIREWLEDEAPRHAAALAYYTAFSLAPLLLIIIALVSLFFEQEIVTGQLRQQLVGIIGQNSADLIDTILESAVNRSDNGITAAIGIVVALLGAAGLFGNLQAALNAMWEVEPKPGGGIMGFIRTRFLSFTMILGIGFLLLVSLVVSSAVATLGEYLIGLAPGMELLINIFSFILSFGVITLLFASIFKVLPDVEIRWRDVWVGALGTAFLFTLGQYLLGLYLSTSAPGAAYGAAGSLILLLVWVYYSAQILLLGAEFTQVYARRYGMRIEPSEHATWAPDAERIDGRLAKGQERVPRHPQTQAGMQSQPETGGSPGQRRLPGPTLTRSLSPPTVRADTRAATDNIDMRTTLIVVASFIVGLFVGARR